MQVGKPTQAFGCPNIYSLTENLCSIVEHLKELIALAVKQQAFPAGNEASEIRALWKAAHQRVLLDEHWLSSLLSRQRSPHLLLVPNAVEESTTVGTAPCACPPAGWQVQGTVPTALGPRVDWGDALAVSIFYGREEELALLSQWIVQEHCRVVGVFGMGGIGKSVLAVSIMHQLVVGVGGQAQGTVPTGSSWSFEVVIFRSLRDAPSCEALLDDCLQVLSPQSSDIAFRYARCAWQG